jgi:hypothetical protein
MKLRQNPDQITCLNKTISKFNNLYAQDFIHKENYVQNLKFDLTNNENKYEIAVGLPITSLPDSDTKLIEVQNFDEENLLLPKFLNEMDENFLQQKEIEFSKTSDLYTMNPLAILDDIISSYQFDIAGTEKIVDCY